MAIGYHDSERQLVVRVGSRLAYESLQLAPHKEKGTMIEGVISPCRPSYE